jgi:uncharacterized protein
MPETTSHAPGTPSWTDLSSPDTDGSAHFYGELFGWEATEPGPVETTGGYRMFELRGKPVAGLVPIMQEGQPPAWTTYVSVASADDAAAKVKEGGGQVMFEPMDVLDVGRMAVFADPAGAVFSVWQPRAHIGAEIVNEPVSLSWNELMTRDLESSRRFYGGLFGWEPEVTTDGPVPYTIWNLDGKPVGGMIEITDDWPMQPPNAWGVYFAVADVDETLAKLQELGGSVVVQPMEAAVGRFAGVTDPHGAFFTVITLSPQVAG